MKLTTILLTVILLFYISCSVLDSEPMNVDIRLTWTAPGDSNNTGTATTYVIKYNTVMITEANWDSSIDACAVVCPNPNIAETAEEFIFTILEAESDTDYYFAIKTADEKDNWSGLSNIPMVTTGDITPPNWIDDLVAEIVN